MSRRKKIRPPHIPPHYAKNGGRYPLSPDAKFIAGPFPRLKEVFQVIRIGLEFIKGFRVFHFVGPAITVFGSSRLNPNSKFYEIGRQVGQEIAKLGFTVFTGGGPGVMEAANRGAIEVGGRSVGANIVLPHEQTTNDYLHESVTFKYFFVRKAMLIKYSYAFVILPGGYGTMDEAFEALTLISTGKLKEFPVIFIGKEYYQGLFNWIRDVLLKNGSIDEDDLDRVHLTDDLEELKSIILESTSCFNLGLCSPPTIERGKVTNEKNPLSL